MADEEKQVATAPQIKKIEKPIEKPKAIEAKKTFVVKSRHATTLSFDHNGKWVNLLPKKLKELPLPISKIVQAMAQKRYLQIKP